jgi:hypothetical protein
MRSYSSTPDCKQLVGDAPPVTGADETGLRKRSLGKARRVLRNADAVSPRDQDETDKNTGTIAGLAAGTDVWQGVANGPPCPTLSRPFQGWPAQKSRRPATVFLPLGHPTQHALGGWIPVFLQQSL